MIGGDTIGKDKKRVKRSANEIAMVQANRFVRHLQSIVNEAKALKSRISDLPASDFTPIAVGFNNVLNDNIPQLTEQVFAVTEKEHVDSPTPEPETSFSDYMNPTSESESETPTSESENEGE